MGEASAPMPREEPVPTLRFRIEPAPIRAALAGGVSSGAADVCDLPLVLCLHGWGMDGDWFARLTQGLFGVPAIFLFPTAPREVKKEDGSVGWSWYDYDGDSDSFVRELGRLEVLLLQFVHDFEQVHGLRVPGRALVGFSQGGYGGSYVALRNPGVFRGLAISGARIKDEALGADLERAAASGMRVLACHGSRDPHVNRDRARASVDALTTAGIETRWEEFDAGHSLGRSQVRTMGGWLAELFRG